MNYFISFDSLLWRSQYISSYSVNSLHHMGFTGRIKRLRLTKFLSKHQQVLNSAKFYGEKDAVPYRYHLKFTSTVWKTWCLHVTLPVQSKDSICVGSEMCGYTGKLLHGFVSKFAFTLLVEDYHMIASLVLLISQRHFKNSQCM